ncbi:hypothetical protein P171DRAFT_524169 [Karstenula rhodostoma CBS 690.94]|uniref:DUF6604 domain-containing protein n=1 Tax=Karstenula rhodostoma CBS 690.94 TaxID=1392251 RepID=A0A9P4PBW5_9PLEO|nr:hypothetical protein P171DRAFT_524169 [Karstenula rhodostoma CBS 690.94]
MDYYGMNELPHSYKRYKGLTSCFQKWLINVAKERGLEIASQVEANAEKRKKTGGSKSHRIAMKDLLPMAEAVAKSGQPSKDVSGLVDLNDAIRIRKEVTEWYRLQHKSDEEHPFFISVLADVRQVFKDWIFVTPTQPEARKDNKGSPDNKKQNSFERVAFIFGYFNDAADTDDIVDDADLDSSLEAEPDRPSDQRLIPPNAPDAESQVIKADLQIDREFEVLCFLYDLYLLRQRVKGVWSDWSQRKIGTMTAAIVSDLAMAHIQQRVTSIAKELNDDGNNQEMLGIVDKLMELIPEDQRDVALSDEENRLPEYPRDLLCYDGIRTMGEYWRLGEAGVGATRELPRHDSFQLRFLLHFKVISSGGLKAPALDKFTEAFCSPDARSKVWLPFGFQVLLDIQQLLLLEDKTMGELRDDVLDHGLYIEDIMRQQIDYEDKMCGIGEQPGYMSTAGFKFSNTYLPTLMQLLDWRLQLQQDDCEEVSEMRNLPFVAAHPIFCGLTMWFYHRIYHGGAIATICWFMVGLAHLYNACRQVGGLKSSWPDLEFIIQSQGLSRIYVGGPPTDPNTFYQRVRLAMGNSVREHASDHYRQRNDRLRSERRQKRGLANYPPLEDKIIAYYQTKSRENRSSLLHNIFVFLYKDHENAVAKGSSVLPSKETSKTSQVKEKVQIIFRTIAIKRALQTKNRKTRKKNKSKVPDFSENDAMHDKALGHAASQLAEHELYANFDHFAFFRRAYTIIKRIRTEVLWDENKALVTLDAAQEPPNDLSLLVNLLVNLAPPQNKKDPVYAAEHALAMKKLKKIAKIMHEFIREQGDLEMKNAEDQMSRRREHGTVPREMFSLGSIKEATTKGIDSEDDPILEIEAKPVKDVAASEVPAENDQVRAKLPDGSQPFQFGNHKNSTFDFEYALPERSDIDIAAKAWEEDLPEALPFYDLGRKGSSEPEGAAIKSEAKPETEDASIELEASSGLEHSVVEPEAAPTPKVPGLRLGLDLGPQRDGVRASLQGEECKIHQGEANATIKGKTSASHFGMPSPTLIKTRVDQEYHGGYDGWSDVDEEIESDRPAEDRTFLSGVFKHAIPTQYPSVPEDVLAAYYTLATASPVLESQTDAEDRPPSPPPLPPCEEDLTNDTLGGSRLGHSFFGVYHRFTYCSTRSGRPPKYISSARRYRLLGCAHTAHGSRRRLVIGWYTIACATRALAADGSEYTGAYSPTLTASQHQLFHRGRIAALVDAGAEEIATAGYNFWNGKETHAYPRCARVGGNAVSDEVLRSGDVLIAPFFKLPQNFDRKQNDNLIYPLSSEPFSATSIAERSVARLTKTTSFLNELRQEFQVTISACERFLSPKGDYCTYFYDNEKSMSSTTFRRTADSIRYSFRCLVDLERRLASLKESCQKSKEAIELGVSIQHHKENALLSRQANTLSREVIVLSTRANSLARDANLIAAENKRVATTSNLHAALMVNMNQFMVPVVIVVGYFSIEAEMFGFQKSTKTIFVSILVLYLVLYLVNVMTSLLRHKSMVKGPLSRILAGQFDQLLLDDGEIGT